jgi:hypothetical protein
MKLDFSKVVAQPAPGMGPASDKYAGEYVVDGPKPSILIDEPKPYQPVKAYDPLDVERAKKGLSVHDKKIKELKRAMDNFVVSNDKTAAVCTEMVAKSANLIKAMETNRKETIKDADTYVRGVNRFVKIFRDQVDAIVSTGKKKIGDYAYSQELKRRELAKKAQDEADKIQAAMDVRAKKSGVEPVQMPAMVVPRKQAPVRTESGSASTKMVWTWEITDTSEIPKAYFSVDVKLVDAAVKAGLRKIAGIKIFERPDVRVRTA